MKPENREQTALLGIVQGGFYEDLRVAHAQEIVEYDPDAYAVGGLRGSPRSAFGDGGNYNPISSKAQNPIPDGCGVSH